MSGGGNRKRGTQKKEKKNRKNSPAFIRNPGYVLHTVVQKVTAYQKEPHRKTSTVDDRPGANWGKRDK